VHRAQQGVFLNYLLTSSFSFTTHPGKLGHSLRQVILCKLAARLDQGTAASFALQLRALGPRPGNFAVVCLAASPSIFILLFDNM